MKITADKSQVLEIYCDWLKNNCDRYEYLSDDARKLHDDIKNMDVNSLDAKEYYLQFMEMFVNNPFLVAASGHLNSENQSGEAIVSYDYRCYFVKNKFDMWLPLELYCRLAVYKTPSDLDQMLNQERISLNRGISEFINFANGQAKDFEKDSEARRTKFASYIKGPGEVKTHLILAVLNIGLGSKGLWEIYRFVQEKGFDNIERTYKIAGAAAALVMANVIIQSLLEFKNKSQKNSVRGILRRIEQAEKAILSGNENAKTLENPLREFVNQMIKAGKSDVSDNEILQKGQIPSWSGNEYKQLSIDKRSLGRVKENLWPHTKFRYILYFILVSVMLTFARGEDIGDFSIKNLLKFAEKEVETIASGTTAADEDENVQEIWMITAGECNLRSEPDGEVITTLMQGETVTVYSWSGDGVWLDVEAMDGTKGWISRRVVKRCLSNELKVVDAEASSELQTKNSGVMSIANALDGVLLTSWQEGVSGYGEGETITLTLDGTQTVDHIMLANGNMKNQESYEQNGRIKTFSVWSDLSEEPQVYQIDDVYDLEGQWVWLDPIEANQITIRIDEVYGGSKYNDTCISEIAVYEK